MCNYEIKLNWMKIKRRKSKIRKYFKPLIAISDEGRSSSGLILFYGQDKVLLINPSIETYPEDSELRCVFSIMLFVDIDVEPACDIIDK